MPDDEDPPAVPAAGEILVRVRGAGLNGADILQMKGGYPAPPGSPADIPGLEFAGEVAECGAGRHDVAIVDARDTVKRCEKVKRR